MSRALSMLTRFSFGERRTLISRCATIVFAGIVCAAAGLRAGDRPSLLAILPAERTSELLLPHDAWRPFPTAEDREFWNQLPETIRRELIAQGEARSAESWAPIPATVFLEFYRSGSKEPYQSLSWGRRHRLGALVIAECVEGKGRFLDAIVDGVWTICEESFWGNSTNTWVQAPIEEQRKYSSMQLGKIRTSLPDVTKPGVDLWVGETAGLLALTGHLLGARLDRVSPMVRPRIRLELERRMLHPCLEGDFTWMTARGNWNPWICSNWLATLLLVETNAHRRAAGLQKILRALDYYLAHYPADGGCDEGPGYWRRSAASLYDCLELLYSATDGKVDIFRHPLVQEAARFIYRVHIADDYFYNFNDGPAKMNVPASLATRFGRRVGDPRLVAFGLSRDDDEALDPGSSLLRRVPALGELAMAKTQIRSAPPLVRNVWLPELQIMTARSHEGSTAGWFVAAKGGNNGEGHNHNDVGDFIVFADGKPVIIDVGPEAYTEQNSGPDRYKIWTMQSAWHNLPTIGGVMQQHGARHSAREVKYTSDEQHARLAMELAGAYPPEAGLTSWHRTVQLEREGELRLTERYTLERAVESLTLSLVTPCRVRERGAGELEFEIDHHGRGVVARFDPAKLRLSVETVTLKDRGLRNVWGAELRRVQLVARTPRLMDEWTIAFRMSESKR